MKMEAGQESKRLSEGGGVEEERKRSDGGGEGALEFLLERYAALGPGRVRESPQWWG